MSLQQRHSSPPDEVDLEITAELPVLDVMAYEAGVAATTATGSQPAFTPATHERDQLNSTDTWIIPAASLRAPKPPASEPPNPVIDENRARLEVNLQALSATLRDVEDRLTRKGERLVEIERALEAAVAERKVAEERAQGLAEEVATAHAGATAAHARVTELLQALEDREAADQARRKRDADAQAELTESNTRFQSQLLATQRDFQEQIASRTREFESQLATQAQAYALAQRDLSEARGRATGYLEALQSNEGRRSVFEDLISTLDNDVNQREARIAQVESDLATQAARVRELESALQERMARISALESQASELSAALATRTEQHAQIEQQRDDLQRTVQSLNGTLSERNERIKVLEGTVSQNNITAAQLRTELESAASERSQLVASAASLEASLKAAVARGDEQDEAARAAQARYEEAEATLAAQRRRVEQLETEVAAVRGELELATDFVQAAGVERNEHMARLAAVDARAVELEQRVADQQETVRQLQAESNASVARSKELEGDLHAAEDTINRLEAECRTRTARVDELEKMNTEWRATVEEARHAITDRDNLIQRLEQETANSAVLIGHIQKSITRLDNSGEHAVIREPAPDGATRLLIRTDGDSEVVHVLGRKTSVGRTPDNDLQIDAKFISRHHAVILVGPAHAIIEDLNSTNGVMVNNRRITRQPLKDGDNVTIGKTQFRFAVRPAKTAS